MKKIVALLFLLLASSAFAQFTTVTGTVLDPNGVPYANGTITSFLVSSSTPTMNGQPYSPPIQPVGLDKNGSFSFNVADNNVLQPAGTKWNFTVCSAVGTTQPVVGTGSQCFTLAAPITITGATQSITTQLHAAALALTIPLGGGGGGGSPPAAPIGSVQTNLNGTNFGSITNVVPGSALVSQGASTPPVFQQKAIYDTRDWMTCDGNGTTGTDSSAAMNTLLSTIGTTEATIRFIGTTTPSATCRFGNTFFGQNITLDFSGGGAIQLISSTTPIGGGSYVNGTSVECGSGITCSLPALSVTAGNTIIVAEAPYPGFTFKTTRVTDTCGNFYIHVFQSLAGQPRNQGAWVASSANAGNCTITATANGSLTTHMMLAAQVAGMGPVSSLDSSASSNATGTTMSSGSTTTLTGAFLFAFGGQPFTFPETCTAGAGYTQPPGAAGQSSPNGSICAEYNNASAGGSTSATQTISSNPSPGTWVYSLISLKPGNATATIWGGIINPDQHQIFYNADSATGHGVVDFTGSGITLDVYPEWWGASSNAAAAVNTPALQAAIWAAYGGGLTQPRTNASGLSQYNRPLRIGGLYQINDELKMFNTNGFKMNGVNRLLSGIVQTATNKRIINGQSNTYGVIDNMSFSTQASQNAALVDIDWNGVDTPGDLKPQFLDFNHVNFSGGGVGFIGLEIAKSGGAAQGSNIYCRDCAFQSFTEACAQVGTHANLAGNALAIGISGDMQGCNKNGIAVYGGGYISFGDGVEESSMENGYSTQTGFDMYCELTQGPCSMDYMRSESRRLISGNDIVLHKTRVINQAAYLPPGGTFPVGSIMTGSVVGGDGAFYTVTSNASAAGGIGTPTAQLRASSGTLTTLVDTNQTVAGSVTVGTFGGVFTLETVTQAVTGSTATILNVPNSSATISGTLTSGNFVFGDTAQQATTGVTCTIGSGNTSVLFNCSNFSGTADATHVWTDLTTLATFSPSGAPVFSVSNPPMLITAATGAPDSTHKWTGNSSGAVYTPTGAPTNEANFTNNAFVGMLVSVLSGKNAGCYGVVTANNAQTITLAAGWITRYYKLGCPFPDTSSGYVVEPNWNHGTVTTGGMTMVYLNENAIDCQTTFGVKGACVPTLRLEDVIVAGGQIRASLSTSVIDDLTVYRQDWFDNSGGQNPQQCCDQPFDWDVHIASTVGPNVIPYQGLFYQSWSLPTQGGASYSGAFQKRLGTKALVWDIGNVGTNNPPANASAASVWIGGRSDSGAGTDPTRNILEYGGMFGRGAPLPSVANNFNTTDQAGTDTDITGGPSTGAGNGGQVCLWISNPGASSQVVNSALRRWCVSTLGHWLAQLDNAYDIGASGANRPRNIFAASTITGTAYATTTNCAVNSVSPAACGSAASGAVVIPTTTTTYTINTTAVTAHSRIQVTWLTFASDLPSSPTCVAPINTTEPTISAVSAGVSFTITLGSTTGQTCPMFQIFN